MKSLLILTAALSASAFASDKENSVESTRTRITCYTDAEYLHESKKGERKQDKEIVNHKTSESIRITWKEGNSEFRFSEYKAFNEDGKVYQIGRSHINMQSKLNGNLLTEVMEITSTNQFVDSSRLWDNKMRTKSTSNKFVVVYEINGDQKIVKESSKNGQPDLSSVGQTATILNAGNKRVEQIVTKTPYVTETENFKTTVLKEKVNCAHESMSY